MTYGDRRGMAEHERFDGRVASPEPVSYEGFTLTSIVKSVCSNHELESETYSLNIRSRFRHSDHQ